MTKIPTAWNPLTSGTVTTVNTGVVRLEQDNTVRLLQDGVTKRILQPNVVTTSTPTIWTENT